MNLNRLESRPTACTQALHRVAMLGAMLSALLGALLPTLALPVHEVLAHRAARTHADACCHAAKPSTGNVVLAGDVDSQTGCETCQKLLHCPPAVASAWDGAPVKRLAATATPRANDWEPAHTDHAAWGRAPPRWPRH